MGAQQSVNAGKAKVDVHVDLTHMLCEALLLPPLRSSSANISQIVGRISLKHPSLFGRSEKLDVILDKGINDSNVVVAFRRPRPEWLSQQSFVIQHSMSPEIAVHGFPADNFTRSGSRGVNLSRLSLGVELNEPTTSNWTSGTSVKFEHIRPVNNDGRSIARDHDGFPLTCSGNLHDNMIILKQESGYADVKDNSFLRVNFQMEQGLPLVPKSLTFNRVKCAVSKGIKLGPTFLVTSLTGGSIVGDMAPYQAFAIGGLGSVRGYGEGAVGSGRLCLVGNCEYTVPLAKHLEGSLFMDCGSDLGSARHVPAKVDVHVDLTHMLCEALLLPPLRSSSANISQIVGRISLKHPSLFGRSEKLDVILDKGINDSNVVVAFRRPRPEWLSQQSFVIQHSMSPEIAVHGFPADNFTRSGSRGVNLSRLSLGVELNEPTTSNWTSGTSVKFEHIRPVNNDGRSIARDHDGFPLTCSGNLHDNMIILKQESGYADVKDNSFLRVNFQMEQGLPLVPKSLTFNRVKCAVSKGIKLGPTFLVTSLTGGSIVGDMAPYQAFAIGGLGSVRGYGEGAVGSGRLCLVGNCEYTVPLAKHLEGSLFMDCGSDLGSARHVPGNPALRQGKPGFGVGFGYGVHFNTDLGQIRVDYAMNAFSRKTLYFSINSGSGT